MEESNRSFRLFDQPADGFRLLKKMTLYRCPFGFGGRHDVRMHWMLPDKSFVPAHYHITEVGKVRKDFIDCGGTVRSTSACLLEIWVAHDVDHRLETTKLASIMRIAGPLLESDDLPMEVEYEQGVISQYPIGGMEITPSRLLFYLGTKHTACLAPEKCGVDGTGCC